jgi:hypothetical protein
MIDSKPLSIIGTTNIIKYTVISAVLCLISFILTRILDTSILAIFAWINNITFNYSPFQVTFPAYGQQGWSEGKVIFIYTLPYLIFGLLGMFMPETISRKWDWKVRLFITWVSFQMILLVSASLIAGIFEFKQIGVALKWLLPYIWLRILLVMITIVFLLFGIRRFTWYFLRAVPTRRLLKGISEMKSWIVFGALIPILLSNLIIIPIGLQISNLNFGVSFIVSLIFLLIIYNTVSIVKHLTLKKRRHYF